MNQISANLSQENILLDVQASSKKRAFEQVAQIFEDQYGIARATVFDSLFARERLGSTALGHGVAIPHGRIPKLEDTHIAVLRLETPIAFDAPDGENVRLLVCLLVPESATQEHLDLLALIAKKLSNEETRRKLFNVETTEEVLSILSESENEPNYGLDSEVDLKAEVEAEADAQVEAEAQVKAETKADSNSNLEDNNNTDA